MDFEYGDKVVFVKGDTYIIGIISSHLISNTFRWIKIQIGDGFDGYEYVNEKDMISYKQWDRDNKIDKIING